MKVYKLALTVLLSGACALSAHAQKQLKYVPQALKGTKTIPYVVNPKLPPTVRANFAMPVVRPNISTAVERQVAQTTALKTPTPSYKPKGRVSLRTSEQLWEEILRFMHEHNGEIPSRTAKDAYERTLRGVWDMVYYRKQGSNNPYVDRLIKLHDEKVRARVLRVSKANAKIPKNILDYLIQYMRGHNGKLPSEKSQDAMEKSYRVALNTFHQKYKDLTDAQVEELEETKRTLEQLFRGTVKQIADDKTPQEIFDYMTQFMREHNGKLPFVYSQDATEKSHCRALYTFHKKYKDLTDEQVEELDEPDRALEKFYRQNVNMRNKKSAE